ncbi:MAG TPA: hypothetical protein VGS27_12980 [Candidatus Sulfotelmatobacter sp.]|nr:hypothetical protein [Candidatus Sulfotelmatobacter sp.]
MRNRAYSFSLLFAISCTTLLLSLHSIAQTETPVGPNSVFVHSKFGGQIFGFDIDQNGTEGVLSEARTLANGNVEAAVETFDQKTGKILAVLVRTQTQDDFITLGVVVTSVGLVEHEHVISFLNVQRTFNVINPLKANKLTGRWTPPIGTKHLLSSVSRNQGTTNNAVFAQDNSGNFIPWVFSSNVAANTFGPVIHITDSFNFGSVPPPMAYNSVTNQAILGGGDGCFGCIPVFGVADLTKGTFTEFQGSGFGFVNGVAVDSQDNIACTATEDDASIEFYDLTTQNVTAIVVLPNSGSQQFFSGADVEFDAIHKLFLVAQPNSSSASGSSIYVYDTRGNLQETLNGFSFSNSFNVIAAHIALNPGTRTGFVDGPSANVNEIQGFNY